MHNCGAVWLRSEHAHVADEGKTIWNGEVEVFNLMQHSTAKMAYAWTREDQFIVVLEIPPVKMQRPQSKPQ
jgi:hypothetical protein